MLVNAMADMDIRNYAGQTCIDVADRKMAKFLEELRSTSNKRVKRRPSSQIRLLIFVCKRLTMFCNQFFRLFFLLTHTNVSYEIESQIKLKITLIIRQRKLYEWK